MMKFSKNKKTNEVLTKIYDSLNELGKSEISRYKKEFPKKTDFNIYEYGNVLVYYDDIRELFQGYKSLKNASNQKIESIYKKQVGYIARKYF